MGAVVLFTMVVGVVAGPLVYRVPIDEIDFRAKLQGPSAAHPFGTDDLGQDLLARMMYGGRISLAVGVAAMLIAIVIGTTIGALSGYVGGMADPVLRFLLVRRLGFCGNGALHIVPRLLNGCCILGRRWFRRIARLIVAVGHRREGVGGHR